MLRIYIAIALSFSVVLPFHAQTIKLQTQLIGSLGNVEDGGNDLKVSYAVGEIMTLTGGLGGPRVFAQGLLQPGDSVVVPPPDFDCKKIANVITPTGSQGLNDTWVIEGLPSGNEVYIFDRWGREVFSETNSYQQNWGGRGKNNEFLEEGAYFFYIKIIDPQQECRGTITIFK